MVAGIKIRNSDNCIVSGNVIVGFDVGIELENCKDISANHNKFIGTETAVKANDIDGLNAAGNIQCDEVDIISTPSPWHQVEKLEGSSKKGKNRDTLLSREVIDFCIMKLRGGK